MSEEPTPSIGDGEIEDILTQEEIDEEYKNKSGKMGGKREGAGRRTGSKVFKAFKKKIRDYTTEKEVRLMVKRAKKIARTDKKMLQFLLEQIFGKPRQNMGLDGGEDGRPVTMAALLDSLEKPKPIKAEIIDEQIIEQGVEDKPLISNQGQELEQDPVSEEQVAETLRQA